MVEGIGRRKGIPSQNTWNPRLDDLAGELGIAPAEDMRQGSLRAIVVPDVSASLRLARSRAFHARFLPAEFIEFFLLLLGQSSTGPLVDCRLMLFDELRLPRSPPILRGEEGDPDIQRQRLSVRQNTTPGGDAGIARSACQFGLLIRPDAHRHLIRGQFCLTGDRAIEVGPTFLRPAEWLE